MNLIYNDKRFLLKNADKFFKKIKRFVLNELKINSSNIEVSVSFLGKEEIKKVNNEYRKINKETDTLSFPAYNSIQDIKKEIKNINKVFKFVNLGDIILCPEVIKKNAALIGHSYEKELNYIFTHSLLHLFSYDHIKKEDKDKMRKFEKLVIKNLYS